MRPKRRDWSIIAAADSGWPASAGAHRLHQRANRRIIFADAVLERTQGRRIGIGERALNRDLHHLRGESVGIDPRHEHARGIRLAETQKQPGAFGDPVDRMDVARGMEIGEQRIAQRHVRPARGDRRVHPPHQGGEEGAARIAPGLGIEIGVCRIEHADRPRVAACPARIFDRRRWRGKLDARDFLDRAFVDAALGRRHRRARCRRRHICLSRRCWGWPRLRSARLLGKRRQRHRRHRRRGNQKRLNAHCLPAAPRARSYASAAPWAGSTGRKERQARARRPRGGQASGTWPRLLPSGKAAV